MSYFQGQHSYIHNSMVIIAVLHRKTSLNLEAISEKKLLTFKKKNSPALPAMPRGFVDFSCTWVVYMLFEICEIKLKLKIVNLYEYIVKSRLKKLLKGHPSGALSNFSYPERFTERKWCFTGISTF